MGEARFFSEQCEGEVIRLPDREARHALKSRRLSAGDAVVVFDGRGTEAHGYIASASRGGVTVRVERVVHRPRPRPALTLFVAPPKGPRQDVLIEKCSELGVAAIYPLVSARAVASVSEHRLGKWRRTAVEAAKQSGQAWLPELAGPIGLEAALDRTSDFDRVLLATSEVNREGAAPVGLCEMLAELRHVASIAAYVGPEGGWTEEEMHRMLAAGARPTCLGPHTLRIETAAVVLAGVIHSIQDDRG